MQLMPSICGFLAFVQHNQTVDAVIAARLQNGNQVRTSGPVNELLIVPIAAR
jgi:hypothetical protein